MIKSHLFEQSEEAIADAQAKWSQMRNTIEELGPSSPDDPLITYLHHVSIGLYGHILADDIFDIMEERVSGKRNAIDFLSSLAKYASDYAAIQLSGHSKWIKYDQRVRTHIDHIHGVRMSFIRPLMLAVAARFDARQTHAAFRAFTSWVVRFLIAGGSRSQIVAITLGGAAHDVFDRRITTAEDLVDAVRKVIPTDPKFHASFCTKSLSSARQARFLLRELEIQKRIGTSDAMLAPIGDTEVLTLEHVLPKNPLAKGWQHFSDDERRAFASRLGNLALLNAKDNGAIGDKPFSDKRPGIEKSQNIFLTKMIVELTSSQPDKWTIDNIRERQRAMADLAVARWPIF